MNTNHVNIQKPKKLFEQSDSLVCAPVVVTGVVMGKGIEYSFLRVIDSPVMDLNFSHFYGRTHMLQKKKIRHTIMEKKYIVCRRIRK